MKVLKQLATVIEQKPGMQGIYEQIETAARTCYQSYSNIADGTAEKMVTWLASKGHTSMLEHGTVYLKETIKDNTDSVLQLFIDDPYSWVYVDDSVEGIKSYYVTTNYRVIIEHYKDHIVKLRKLLCEPTIFHEKRYTIMLTTNLQVATELLRHRKMSFAMESSRYCCYDQEKFGDELQFILPCWFNENTPKSEIIEWSNGMQDAENHYMRCRAMGWTAEKCAQYLPKATKTTLVMTGDATWWKHLLKLRYEEVTGKVHPQMKELATMIYELIGDKL